MKEGSKALLDGEHAVTVVGLLPSGAVIVEDDIGNESMISPSRLTCLDPGPPAPVESDVEVVGDGPVEEAPSTPTSPKTPTGYRGRDTHKRRKKRKTGKKKAAKPAKEVADGGNLS